MILCASQANLAPFCPHYFPPWHSISDCRCGAGIKNPCSKSCQKWDSLHLWQTYLSIRWNWGLSTNYILFADSNYGLGKVKVSFPEKEAENCRKALLLQRGTEGRRFGMKMTNIGESKKVVTRTYLVTMPASAKLSMFYYSLESPRFFFKTYSCLLLLAHQFEERLSFWGQCWGSKEGCLEVELNTKRAMVTVEKSSTICASFGVERQ